MSNGMLPTISAWQKPSPTDERAPVIKITLRHTQDIPWFGVLDGGHKSPNAAECCR